MDDSSSAPAQGPTRLEVSDREKVPRPGVRRRMTQLRHSSRLYLADPFPRQVEVLTNLFERTRLSPVQAEAQPEDLALALVEG